MNRRALPFLLAAALLALAAGAAAAPGEATEKGTMKIDVRDEDGSTVKLEVSAGWLGALLSVADLDCERVRDAEAREMMLSLQQQGEGGVWKERDDDGDQVLARRAKGMLKIESTEPDGDRALIEMPWEVAACLMLGVDPPGDLGRRLARGEAKFKVDVRDDGGRVRLAIE